MSQVFTEYVRSLDPKGEQPDAKRFEEVWAALGRALVSELKKRGLLGTPPSYLGVYGYSSWRQAEVGGEALEELLAGCYAHIFIRRLGGLKAQLKAKPNIEGLVFLGIRNFLHDTQKKHDPLGYRIFDVLQRALCDALDDGELVRLAGDRRLCNDTVLGFDVDADPEQLAGEELAATIKSWNDTLLPDLVTARGKARERTIAVLRSLVARLSVSGVTAFSFRQLIEPLKNDARARWRALFESQEGATAIESDGELLTLVRQVQPDTSLEERDSFEKLSLCLAESLDRLGGPARTRGYLSTLWEYLRTYAAGTDGTALAGAPAASGGLPSARKLARHLGIPRDRLPGLFATLGSHIQNCRAAISRRPPVNSLKEGRAALNDRQKPNGKGAW